MKKIILSALVMAFTASTAMADISRITRQYNATTDQYRINFYDGTTRIGRHTGNSGQSFAAALHEALYSVRVGFFEHATEAAGRATHGEVEARLMHVPVDSNGQLKPGFYAIPTVRDSEISDRLWHFVRVSSTGQFTYLSGGQRLSAEGIHRRDQSEPIYVLNEHFSGSWRGGAIETWLRANVQGPFPDDALRLVPKGQLRAAEGRNFIAGHYLIGRTHYRVNQDGSIHRSAGTYHSVEDVRLYIAGSNSVVHTINVHWPSGRTVGDHIRLNVPASAVPTPARVVAPTFLTERSAHITLPSYQIDDSGFNPLTEWGITTGDNAITSGVTITGDHLEKLDEALEEAYHDGYVDGYGDGYVHGYDSGYDLGFEDSRTRR